MWRREYIQCECFKLFLLPGSYWGSGFGLCQENQCWSRSGKTRAAGKLNDCALLYPCRGTSQSLAEPVTVLEMHGWLCRENVLSKYISLILLYSNKWLVLYYVLLLYCTFLSGPDYSGTGHSNHSTGGSSSHHAVGTTASLQARQNLKRIWSGHWEGHWDVKM